MSSPMDFFQFSTFPLPDLQNFRLLVSYDGTPYLGWQESIIGPTIAGTLQKTLQQILQEDVLVEAASRTDRGVHAEGQVAHFLSRKRCNEKELHKSLNALLPETIRVMEIKQMELSFHPTLDAKGKEYHYQIYQGTILPPKERHYCWHIHTPLSLNLMREAACHFLGKKDFSSFTNTKNDQKEGTEIALFAIDFIEESEHKLKIVVRGERFQYKMVRNIVGTLVFVGQKRISPHSIPSIFSQKDRRLSGMTAPAMGLTLMKVFYEW